MIQKHNPNYKWYILFLTMMTYAVIAGLERLCMPVLFKQIGDDLGLGVVAIGAVWGMDPLAGVFVGLPSGLLADRFGVKRSLTVLCILAGVFCAVRGFSTNFITLAMTMFLFGMMAAATPNVVPKVTAEWFSGKRLAFTNALLNVAWSFGSMFATQFSATLIAPAIGGWRNVLFLYGAPALVLGFLWLFTGREPDKTENPEHLTTAVPFRQAIAHVIRIKEVWIIGLVTMMLWGCTMGYVGYLPLYLRNAGWDATSADSTITLLSLMMCLGSIPMVLLSDKLKSRKIVVIISITSVVVCLALLPFVSNTWIWILIAISSFLRSGANALFNVMIFEAPGVGAAYGGTAIGLANSVSMIGAFIAPPLGNSLSQYGDAWPFIFWSCLAAASAALVFLIKTKKAPATSY